MPLQPQFVGGPLCGCEVHCSKTVAAVLLRHGKVRLTALYYRDTESGHFHYRRTLAPAAAAKMIDDNGGCSVFYAEPVRWATDYDDKPLRQWTLVAESRP